eukprot:5149831-Pleurochrysis_carterae.AAC.1
MNFNGGTLKSFTVLRQAYLHALTIWLYTTLLILPYDPAHFGVGPWLAWSLAMAPVSYDY